MIRKVDTLISLPATDVPRAVKFYTEVLGCRAIVEVPEKGFYIFQPPAGETMLGVHRHEGPLPAPDRGGIWFWLTVEQIGPVKQMMSQRGVRFLGEPSELGPGFEQPFLDSEGNVLQLYEPIREVRRSVTIEAEPEEVFAALTDASEIERWFAAIDDVEFEARVGGRVGFKDPIFGAVEGRVTVLEAGRRLAIEFSANWPERLEFNLARAGKATRVEVLQSGFDPVRDRDFGIPTMLRGIETALAALGQMLLARSVK